MPHRRLICAAHGCGKTEHLIRAARQAQAAGVPVRCMLALTVHASAAAGLRDRLRAALNADVPVTTLRRRALSLLAGDPPAAALPPDWQEDEVLSGIDRRLLIRRAWAAVAAERASLWHARSDQPGALDWVARLFDLFSTWAGSADPGQVPPLLPTADPGLAELWHAYRGYLELCYTYGVVGFAEIVNRARDALRRRPLQPPRLLLLDDLDLFDPAELLFVSALIGPQTEVIATACGPPDAQSALAAERFLAAWLAQHGCVLEHDATTSSAAPRLGLGEYPTPEDEAEAIIAAIAAQDDPAACAIIAFDSELPVLLRRCAARVGVPLAGMAQRDGYTLALAPLALAGLKLIAAQPLSATEQQALLRHPALGLPPADARLLAEEVRLARAAPLEPDTPLPAGLSAAGQARLALIRQATGAARASALPPSARLSRWLEATELAAHAWQQTDAALSAAEAQIDRRLWARLIGFLEQTERLRQRLGLPFTPADAVEVFGAAQALVEPESPPLAGAVQLWSPAELGGRAARHVFITGLHEGALPPPPIALPLIDEAALVAACRELPGFVPPQLEDRAATWLRGLRALQRAVGRARVAAHLSYSRANREGARRLPSPLLAAYLGLTPDRSGSLTAAADQAGLACATAAQPVTRRGVPLLQPGAPLRCEGARAPESPFVVTPSQIEDWFACPRRCFYARRLRLDDVVSAPRQALGQIVHAALHHLLRVARGAPIDDRRALALLDECWDDDLRFWGTPLRARVFRRLAEQAVLNLARFERERSDGAAFIAGELELRWALPHSDSLLRARLDRIDADVHGLHIIDYKLGSQSPSLRALLGEWLPPAQADPARWRPGDLQLPLYALALEQGAAVDLALPSSRVRSVTLIYPLALYNEAGRPSATGVRRVEIIDHGDNCAACSARAAPQGRVALLCRRQLAMIETWARRAVEAMRADVWQPDPRDGQQTCARCPFRAICPDPR
ncbi:PD-(D/E)XK nuclease family protein [Kallotenue papyrolyticum]|uniref:PD-(D/E)XK nuclease family protein n=1 Tax=Kallotenue papyrolyticum TaxID=1325125 RepID=UPI000478626F|nr:PD-(D/E)XK nuclease family protein [Kallotenue papyrolyticum]